MLGSTLQHLGLGKPTEIDYLNGEIVCVGEQVGMRTPLVEMVHHMEETNQFWSISDVRAKMSAARKAK